MFGIKYKNASLVLTVPRTCWCMPAPVNRDVDVDMMHHPFFSMDNRLDDDIGAVFPQDMKTAPACALVCPDVYCSMGVVGYILGLL